MSYITIIRGDRSRLDVTIDDLPAGAEITVAEFTVRRLPDDAAALITKQLGAGVTIAANVATVVLDPDDTTVALEPSDRRLVWSLRIQLADNSGPYTVDSGILHLRPEPYIPSIDQVAALMRARLKTEYDEATTFTEDTRPSASMVEGLIDQAAGLIAPSIGFDLPSKFWSAAQSIITLQAALLIEPSYFPEQARPDKSAWEQWEKMLDRVLPALVAAIAAEQAAGDQGVGVGGAPGRHLMNFPDISGAGQVVDDGFGLTVSLPAPGKAPIGLDTDF